MKYFTNINTLDELKAAYRRLSIQKQRPGIEAEKRIDKRSWEK